jgi:anaerobic dimethyl sulfoxide reductase subunit C (anchor subunit)
MAAVAISALLQWRGKWRPLARRLVALLTGLIGLILIFCMSRLYMLPTVPPWNHAATPVSFYLTAFLLGSLAVGCVLALRSGFSKSQEEDGESPVLPLPRRYSFMIIGRILLVLIALEVVFTPLSTTFLAMYRGTPHLPVMILRVVLLVLGAGLTVSWLHRLRTGNRENPPKSRLVPRNPHTYAHLAFLSVLAAEVLGRFLFYATFARVGV